MDLLLFLVQSNLICLHFPFNLIVLAFGFYLFVFVSQNIQRIFPQKYAEKHNQWNRIFANCQLFHAVQSISIRFIFVKYFFFYSNTKFDAIDIGVECNFLCFFRVECKCDVKICVRHTTSFLDKI